MSGAFLKISVRIAGVGRTGSDGVPILHWCKFCISGQVIDTGEDPQGGPRGAPKMDFFQRQFIVILSNRIMLQKRMREVHHPTHTCTQEFWVWENCYYHISVSKHLISLCFKRCTFEKSQASHYLL